jgi:hypothetical protein
MSFTGLPGMAYTIQRAENFNGVWSNVATVTIGGSSIATCADTNSPASSAFYRTTYR